MKRIAKIICVLFMALPVCAQSFENTVNAVIGDVSYQQRFGRNPNESTNEILRLQTHLSYVEAMLSSKDVSHLSESQQRNRAAVMELLREYWMNGVFPTNYDYPGRRPCFIDRDGNICAVGYLIEKTVGREVAEAINEDHQYDYLLDMDEEVIARWADTYGLTLEECAMIQPAYGWQPVKTEAPIPTSYGISSGFAGGANIGINIMNLKGSSPTVAYIGFLTGATQVVLGLTHLKKDKTTYGIVGGDQITSYKAQNNLSYINIAAGTTTILTSAFNLFINSKMKDKRNALGLYSYPGANNQMTAGLSFSRSL